MATVVTNGTLPDEMQKCPSCDALVDPASFAEVVFHLFDAGCVTGVDRRETFGGIIGQKVTTDA